MASGELEVSVLFSDIQNFTARVENMEAKDTAAFLNDHFGTGARCVEDEGGTIDNLIGASLEVMSCEAREIRGRDATMEVFRLIGPKAIP